MIYLFFVILTIGVLAFLYYISALEYLRKQREK